MRGPSRLPSRMPIQEEFARHEQATPLHWGFYYPGGRAPSHSLLDRRTMECPCTAGSRELSFAQEFKFAFTGTFQPSALSPVVPVRRAAPASGGGQDRGT